MAIGGVNGYGGISPLTQRPQRALDPGVEAPTRTQHEPVTPDVVRTPVEVDDAVPAQAPPGTDPELWQLLTAEERRFFTKLHDTGPLTYGPKTANTPPGLLRGGRFDRTV